MVRYGHALIPPNPEHRDGAEVLDPRYWAPLADGSWVYLLPMAGGSGDIISALVYVWFDGTLYVTRREFNGSVVGPIIEELGQTQTPGFLSLFYQVLIGVHAKRTKVAVCNACKQGVLHFLGVVRQAV